MSSTRPTSSALSDVALDKIRDGLRMDPLDNPARRPVNATSIVVVIG
jgi:hypothetical protein